MLVETAIERPGISLAGSPAMDSSLGLWRRPSRFLAKLVLVGLLLTYLVGLVQDFQRIRRLEAEPTPPFKVITKYEAWQRIYPRPVQLLRRPVSEPVVVGTPGDPVLLGEVDLGEVDVAASLP